MGHAPCHNKGTLEHCHAADMVVGDHQSAALLGTPLGGGMMQENTQLYREGNIIQVTIMGGSDYDRQGGGGCLPKKPTGTP